MSKIKVLVLAANPQDTVRLAVDAEIRNIENAIRESEYRDSVELISALDVHKKDLLSSLNRHQPHIVQFSGHGEPSGEITFADGSIDSRVISLLFSTLKDNIRVVLFNSCYSRVQAESIVETIDCAIGINGTLEDSAAITFVTSFYGAIGYGRSVRDAFEQGLIALLVEGVSEEDYPELLTRDGVDPSKLNLVAAQGQSSKQKGPNKDDSQPMGSVELSLDKDFDKFTSKEQEIILRAIKELLKINNARISGVKPGSVRLTVDLPQDKVDELIDLVRDGELEWLGITDAKSKTKEESTLDGQVEKDVRSASLDGISTIFRYEAGDVGINIHISLDIDNQSGDRRVAGFIRKINSPQTLIVSLLDSDNIVQTTNVDDDGHFRFNSGVSSKSYDLIISSSESSIEIHVQNLQV